MGTKTDFINIEYLSFIQPLSICCHLPTMSPTPQWVKDLKPSAPQGAELIKVEREKSKISVEKLSNFLFTKDVLERQAKILKILEAEKVFDKSQNYFDGRVDKFKTFPDLVAETLLRGQGS